MSERIVIRGVGVLGGFGCGVDDLLAAAARPPGPNATRPVPTAQGHVDLALHAADTDRLADYVSKRRLRRVDPISRMTTLGVCLALSDAGVSPEDRPGLGVILASGFGANATTLRFLDGCRKYGDVGASPLEFSGSGHSGALSNATILLGIRGPLLTVCQPDLAVAAALLAARAWLCEGRVNAVVVGAVEEYCDLLGYVWQAHFGAGEYGWPRPLDFDRPTAVFGEGAAFLLLEKGGPGPVLEDVHMGRFRTDDLEENRPLILCADGRGCVADAYAEAAGHVHAPVAAYAPAFGSSPSGMAFNLAVAAAGMRRGALPTAPECGQAPVPSDEGNGLDCLEITRDGMATRVTLRSGLREEPRPG